MVKSSKKLDFEYFVIFTSHIHSVTCPPIILTVYFSYFNSIFQTFLLHKSQTLIIHFIHNYKTNYDKNYLHKFE